MLAPISCVLFPYVPYPYRLEFCEREELALPIYEYQCEACGNQFETIQKFTEDPLKDCESCGEPKLRKLISPVAFHLKGSGWYETDFKNKGSGPAAASDEATKSEKSEASSDSAEKPQSDKLKTSEKSTETASKKQDTSNTQSTSAS